MTRRRSSRLRGRQRRKQQMGSQQHTAHAIKMAIEPLPAAIMAVKSGGGDGGGDLGGAGGGKEGSGGDGGGMGGVGLGCRGGKGWVGGAGGAFGGSGGGVGGTGGAGGGDGGDGGADGGAGGCVTHSTLTSSIAVSPAELRSAYSWAARPCLICCSCGHRFGGKSRGQGGALVLGLGVEAVVTAVLVPWWGGRAIGQG